MNMKSQWNLPKKYEWKAFGLLNKNLAILGAEKCCNYPFKNDFKRLLLNS